MLGVEAEGRLTGLALIEPVEHHASVFSRSSEVADRLIRAAGVDTAFAEVELARPREAVTIYATSLEEAPRVPMRHRPFVVARADRERVAELVREMYGTTAARWTEVAFSAGEACLAVDVGGLLAGVAWLTVVGPVARLHTLSVRPGFRRMGIGTDLASARLLLARHVGARRAISEIAETNAGSRAVAERVGMAPSGRMFLYSGSPPTPGGTPRFPRSG